MKILYDSQMFLKQKYGGITKYFCELMKNLPKEHSYKLALLFADNQHLKDYQLKKINVPLPKADFKGKGRLKTNFYNINKIYSNYQISLHNYDLFHPTYYDSYFLKNLRKPFIVTVHDLIEFKFKEQYKNNSLIPEMETIIRKANRIIAISENTKKDLIEILKIPSEKIDVIYHGYNKSFFVDKQNKFGRYILFVGYRQGYKNFSTLAKAFSTIILKDQDLKLICVGQPFNKEELQQLKNLNILEKTFALGVTENKLNQLYSHALAFIYPTLFEGFGMPILEAFANNCPVCLSNTSSLPEIAANAAEYFDPNDVESMVNAISKVVYNFDFSQQLVSKGTIRLNNFSWAKCSQETIASYERAIS
jgi:glycosyltransferase involved in cell wall biosynthesis